MKVLFLDIDGVLNKDNTKEDYYYHGEWYQGLEPSLVQRYREWLKDKEDLVVVLSSDWRRWDDTQKLLEDNCIFWDSVTEVRNNSPRSIEIAEWLETRPEVTHIAILDDNLISKPVGRYFVRVASNTGLQDKHLRKVNKLLGYDASSN